MTSLTTLQQGPRGERPEGGALGLRIGDLAKATGRTARALRLYEEMGLLTPGERSAGGFRLYGADAIERVRWIGQLQDLGLSLNDIHDAVKDAARHGVPREAMAAVRELFQGRLEELSQQITRLSALKEDVRAALLYLDGCAPCRVNDHGPAACASCCEHGGDEPPALVRGVADAAAQSHHETQEDLKPRPATDRAFEKRTR